MIGHCMSCGSECLLAQSWDRLAAEMIWLCAACETAAEELGK